MKNLVYSLSVFILILSSNVLAQENLVYEMVQQEKAKGKAFKEVSNAFKQAAAARGRAEYFIDSEEVHFLEYDEGFLMEPDGGAISLSVPMNRGALQVELVEVPASFYSYKVTTSEGEELPADHSVRHYRGVVKDDPNSIAAFSFMKGEAMGLVATDEGNFNLAKDETSGHHIFYNDKNLKEKPTFECGVKGNENPHYEASVLWETSKKAFQTEENCVRFYFETEYDMFQTRGSMAAVTGFVTGLYNQVAVLYQNENIQTTISEIHVWTTPDPYTATDGRLLLGQFQNERVNFIGDLGQLLTFRNLSPNMGYADESMDGICNPAVAERLSVAMVANNFQTVPTYSFSVHIVAHEFGHLMGSRHTNACVWNENDTAIDGCRVTEGDCHNPGFPANGGTIMSLCHDVGGVGVNFNLGFGLQPGNVIRNSVHNATCLCDCFSGSLSGPSQLCGSSVYDLSSALPSGASVSWSATPAGAVSITGSGTSRTVAPVGSYNGLVTLKATIGGLVCDDMEIQKFVWVGPPSDMLIAAASHWGPPTVRQIDPSTTTFAEAYYDTANVNQGNYYLLVHGVQEYEWEIWNHTNWSIIPQHGGGPPFSAEVEIDYWQSPLPVQQAIYIRARNACGWGWWSETYWDVIGGCSFCAFTVYPNPASEAIHVRLENEGEEASADRAGYYTIGVYDEGGNVIWEKETESREEYIPVAGWKSGIYHVRIQHPEGNFAQKVIVKH